MMDDRSPTDDMTFAEFQEIRSEMALDGWLEDGGKRRDGQIVWRLTTFGGAQFVPIGDAKQEAIDGVYISLEVFHLQVHGSPIAAMTVGVADRMRDLGYWTLGAQVARLREALHRAWPANVASEQGGDYGTVIGGQILNIEKAYEECFICLPTNRDMTDEVF